MHTTNDNAFGNVHAVKSATDSRELISAANEALRTFKSAEPADSTDPDIQAVPAKFRSIILQAANREYESAADTARINARKLRNAHLRAILNYYTISDVEWARMTPQEIEKANEVSAELAKFAKLPQNK